MTDKPITVVETPFYIKQAEKLWAEEERASVVDYLARNPAAGDIIPDTGGVRKLRWGRAGMGKRGGARVVYFYYHDDAPVYLLLAYPKAKQEDLTVEEKKAATAFVEQLKRLNASKGRVR